MKHFENIIMCLRVRSIIVNIFSCQMHRDINIFGGLFNKIVYKSFFSTKNVNKLSIFYTGKKLTL